MRRRLKRRTANLHLTGLAIRGLPSAEGAARGRWTSDSGPTIRAATAQIMRVEPHQLPGGSTPIAARYQTPASARDLSHRFRFRSRALDPCRGKLRPERVSA